MDAECCVFIKGYDKTGISILLCANKLVGVDLFYAHIAKVRQ